MFDKIKRRIESFFSQYPSAKIKKGKLIIETDKKSDLVFYLKKGHVRSFTYSSQGLELTLHIFAPGSFFPMMDVISGVQNHYEYEALTDVEVFQAPKEKVSEFIKSEPEVLFDLTRRLFLALDKVMLRIEYLAIGKAENRIASALLFLSRHFGTSKKKNVQIKYLFTHKDIAAFAGLSRETTSRQIEKLIKDQTISYDKHMITINKMDELRKSIDL